MRARPTPNPDHDPDLGPEDLPPEVREHPLSAFMTLPHLYPHPGARDGREPGTWPETPYLVLLQGATDNVIEAEHALAPSEDTAWVAETMRRTEWTHVCAVHYLRTAPSSPGEDPAEPVRDEEWLREIDELVRLGALAGRTAREPDRYAAAYLARVREVREEHEAAEDAETEAEEQLRDAKEQLRDADEQLREADELLARFGRRHERARPLSRLVTALLGLVLAVGGLSALTLPYAPVHLAVLFGAVTSAYVVWSNLRYDPRTRPSILVSRGLVGLFAGGALAVLLHNALAYLTGASWEVLTAGLYGLAALTCWVLAATGVGGLHPQEEPPRPEDPERPLPPDAPPPADR